jgi:hypothetical protein
VWLVIADRRPDLVLVDALARLELQARRLGGSVTASEIWPCLDELLDLVGLRGEVARQAEGGEEIGVEERMEPGDPVA